MPLPNLGLYNPTPVEGRPQIPVVAIGIDLYGPLYRPMQLFIKFSVDKQGIGTQKVYLQQVVTRYVGGKYEATKGYTYSAVNTTKAAGIQRLITNLSKLDAEIDGLMVEANRFMYMYCLLDRV